MKKPLKVIVIILAIFGVLGIIAGGFIVYFITKVDYKYNGEQLFAAVNEYRQSINLPVLTIEPKLCDNLVERWISIKEPYSGHKGFEEWLKAEGIDIDPKFGQIGELYVTGISTPQNAINFWLGSPGHKSTLELPYMVYGCAYANDGAGVLIMASPKSKN